MPRDQETQKKILIFAAKLLVAGALGYWMLHSGTLDAGSLRVLGEPRLVLWMVGTFVGVSLGLGTLRWTVLLRAFGVRLEPGRAVALQHMALFFNTVIPGNLGGDFIKNLYVLRGRPLDVVALAVTERLLGMIALIWAGFIVTLVNFRYVTSQPAFLPWLGVLSVLAISSAVAPFFLVLVLPRILPQAGTGPLGNVIRQISSALEVLRARPRSGLVVFGISLLIHAGNLSYFYQITRSLVEGEPRVATIALLFPTGMLSLMLPISVAGVGVGHMAFEQLFEAVGLSAGANVFHVFLVGNIGPTLLGAIPYLFLRRTRAAPDAASP